MLDAYIIDRIRREREEQRREGALIPLHIEAPRPTHPPDSDDESGREDPQPRGSFEIDFQL